MKSYLIAAAILFASAGAAWSQTVVPCTDTDPVADTSGACSAAPSINPDDLISPDELNGPAGIDPGTTSSITTSAATTSPARQSPTPLGMAPLVVPNDPLGRNTGQSAFGSGNAIVGSQGSMNGNGGITSPAIR